jgi:hypothetical protein
MDSEKKLISCTEKYYTDEGDIDFKMTYCEHQLMLECLTHCLNTFDFAIPLYLLEDYLDEKTISYKKSDSILNMQERLLCLMHERQDETPYERVEAYIDEEGHKSYVTIPLNDN